MSNKNQEITGLAHLRLPKADEARTLNARGGITVGYDLVPQEDGTTLLYTTQARCHPNDNYQRSVGRQMVTGRIRAAQRNDGHSKVGITVLDDAFFGGKKVEVKKTESGVYYIDKSEFNLHDAILDSLMSQSVATAETQMPFPVALKGEFVRRGGYLLMVIDYDHEWVARMQAQFAAQSGFEQAAPETAAIH